MVSLPVDAGRLDHRGCMREAPARAPSHRSYSFEPGEAAANLAALDRAVIVIAGDPEAILPQLSAIGITDVETIDLALPDSAVD